MTDKVRHLHAAGAGHSGISEKTSKVEKTLAGLLEDSGPEPIGVSFRQTESGVRTVYVNLTMSIGGIARRETVCESPLVTLEYDSADRVVGLEIVS